MLQRSVVEIAEDETRHAALSWQVARWTDPLLNPEQRISLERGVATRSKKNPGKRHR